MPQKGQIKIYSWPVLLVFSLGIACSVLIFTFMQIRKRQSIQGSLQEVVDHRIAILEKIIDHHSEIVFSLVNFFNSTPQVSRAAFQRFTEPLISRHPNIAALEWVPRVYRNERYQYELAAQNEGYPGYQITRRNRYGEMVRIEEKDEYFPVYYLEPFAENEAAMGFDLSSESMRRATLQLCCDTGQARAVQVVLVQQKKNRPGFLLFAPVYTGKPQTVSERRAALTGYVLGVFHLGDTFDAAINRFGHPITGVNLWIENIDQPGKKMILTQTTANQTNPEIKWLHYTKTLEIAGQRWQIASAATSQFLRQHNTTTAHIVLLANLLLSCLLTSFYHRKLANKQHQKLLAKTSETMLGMDLEQAIKAALEDLCRYLYADFGLLCIYNEEEQLFTPQTTYTGRKNQVLSTGKLPATDFYHLYDQLKNGDTAFIPELNSFELELPEWVTNSSANSLLLLHMHDQDQPIGFIEIGWRPSRAKFTPAECSLATMLTNLIAMGLRRDSVERKLRRSTELLHATGEAKSNFLSNMSHEIRTPMNAIIGMAELLSDTTIDAEQKKYVDVLHNAGEMLLSLLNDILDLSKIEAGKVVLEDLDFNLESLVTKTTDLLAIDARSKDLYLQYQIDPGVPLALCGDAERLRQIISNLIRNAIKFTASGGVTLLVENGDSVPGQLRFLVRDTGVGISAQNMLHLFDSFTQADSSITRKFGGTGLGLAISKQLAELMGGQIWVESEESIGSTFGFTAQFKITEPLKAVATEQSVAPATKRQLPKANILLVEDSSDNRLL